MGPIFDPQPHVIPPKDNNTGAFLVTDLGTEELLPVETAMDPCAKRPVPSAARAVSPPENREAMSEVMANAEEEARDFVAQKAEGWGLGGFGGFWGVLGGLGGGVFGVSGGFVVVWFLRFVVLSFWDGFRRGVRWVACWSVFAFGSVALNWLGLVELAEKKGGEGGVALVIGNCCCLQADLGVGQGEMMSVGLCWPWAIEVHFHRQYAHSQFTQPI